MKKEKQKSITSCYGNDEVFFSGYGLGCVSEQIIKQLSDFSAEVLGIKFGLISKQFNFIYKRAYSYFAGRGKTLHQETEVDTYSAFTTAVAAGVVYKPSQVFNIKSNEKSIAALSNW